MEAAARGTEPLDCLVLGEGPTVVLVHGSGTGPEAAWAKQLGFQSSFRLVLPDRRGYGRSPRAANVDFDVDARDIAALLGNGAHLVGYSYGGVGSLLAATLRPEAVLSLTLIEPPLFGICAGDPAVEELLSRLRPVFADAPTLDAAEYDRRFDAALGFDHVVGTHTDLELARLDAARRERPPWEAQPDLDVVRNAPFEKLVFRGDWSPAFARVAERLAAGIGADLVTIPGGHPVQHRDGFNQRVESLWRR